MAFSYVHYLSQLFTENICRCQKKIPMYSTHCILVHSALHSGIGYPMSLTQCDVCLVMSRVKLTCRCLRRLVQHRLMSLFTLSAGTDTSSHTEQTWRGDATVQLLYHQHSSLHSATGCSLTLSFIAHLRLSSRITE